MTTPTWTNTGSIPNVTVEGLDVHWRYHKANVRLRLSGSGAASLPQSAELYVRPAGGGTTRTMQAPDKQSISTGTGTTGYFGMATRLVPNAAQSYDLSVIINNGAGSAIERVDLAKTTKASIGTSAALLATANYYVREDGADTNAGTANTSGGAWRTLGKAMQSAPASAVVRVEGGSGGRYYSRCSTARGGGLGAISFVSSHPAADDTDWESGGPQEANAGSHAVLMDWQTAPTGAPGSGGEGVMCATAPAAETDTRFFGTNGSAWSIHTTTTPSGLQAYALALGAFSPTGEPAFIGWSDTKTGKIWKLGVFSRHTGVVDTADRAVELLNTARDHHFGAVVIGTTLYVKLPSHASNSNPNTLYMWWGGRGIGAGASNLWDLSAPDVRVDGLELRCGQAGIQLNTGADRFIASHCEFRTVYSGVLPRGVQNGAVNSTYANDTTVWHCRMLDSNMWNDNPRTQPSISWAYIKGYVGKDGGTTAAWIPTGGSTSYGNRRMADSCEVNGFWGAGGATNTSLIGCRIDGPFNGVSGYHVGFDQYAMYGFEAQGIYFARIADDCLEPESTIQNWACHDIFMTDSFIGISIASVYKGPVYLWNIRAYRLGLHGMRRCGESVSGQNYPTSSAFMKYLNSDIGVEPDILFANITVWSDRFTSYRIANGVEELAVNTNVSGAMSAGGSGSSPHRIRMYNSLTYGNADSWLAPSNATLHSGGGLFWIDKNNYWSSTGSGPGTGGKTIRYASVDRTTMAAYRTATTHSATRAEQGTTSNEGLPGGGLTNGSFRVAPHTPTNQFAGDPTAGYAPLALAAGSIFRAAGVAVPGIMDIAGTHYGGAVPDLGAMQFAVGAPPTLPAAPSGLNATKSGSDTINLAWTDNASDETSYVVERSLDGVTAWVAFPSLAANAVAYSDTGLPGAATRYYRVGAVNGAGTSYSNVDSDTTDPSASAPAAPTSLLATALSSSSIGLTWIDNASDETSYLVIESDNGVDGWSNAPNGDLGINAQAYVRTGLSAEQTKYFLVFAKNPIGDSLAPPVVSATTLPSAPPSSGNGRTTLERTTRVRTTAVRTTA